MASVAVSRTRNETLIFTDDAEKLARKIARPIEKVAITQPTAEKIECPPQTNEIKLPLITSYIYRSPLPKIEIESGQQKIGAADEKPQISRENLIEENLPMIQSDSAEQSVEPAPNMRQQFVNVVGNNPTDEKTEANQEKLLEPLQADAPPFERAGSTENPNFDARRTPNAAVPENERDEMVKVAFLKFEEPQQQMAVEREDFAVNPEAETVPSAINSLINLSSAEELPAQEVKVRQSQEKPVTTTGEMEKRQKILIEEILQMSRDSLAKQDINPDPEAWQQFVAEVSSVLPHLEADERQEKNLELAQENVPPSERIRAAGKSALDVMHAISKATEGQIRDGIVKRALYNTRRNRYRRAQQADHRSIVES